MNNLMNTAMAAAFTMTSLELREIVNTARVGAGEKPVRNDDFLARVVDELNLPTCEIFAGPNSRGTESEYAVLTPDQCVLVGMRESKAVRRTVLAKLKETQTPHPQLPKNYREALLALVGEVDQREAAEAALSIAAPKAEAFEKLADARGSKTFREVAKFLEIKEPALRAFLSAVEMLYLLNGDWVPYAAHIDAGRLVLKTGKTDSGYMFTQTHFTAKGVTWVAEQWTKARGLVAA
jgi:phage antirepressor YoqD-like protein